MTASLNLVDAACRAGVSRFACISVLSGETLRHSNPLIETRESVADRLREAIPQTIVLRPTGFSNDIDAYSAVVQRGRVWLIGDGATRINPVHGADMAALEAGLAAERAVIAGAQHNVQRTGAPFNERLEEFLTSAEARGDR